MSKSTSGFIYIWRDRKHKRFYIGLHWGREDDGYICSSRWMRKAYKRRPEDFKRRIIKKCFDKSSLYEEERHYLSMIKKEEIKVRYYNLNIKGNQQWHMDPERVKIVGPFISSSNLGKNRGPRSEEIKAKISKSNTGKVRSEETRKKYSDAKKGTKHSDETKALHAQQLKEQWASGERKGTPKTDEQRKALSERQKGICTTIPTEESRSRQSEARKALWADPAYRDRMTEIRRNRKNQPRKVNRK